MFSSNFNMWGAKVCASGSPTGGRDYSTLVLAPMRIRVLELTLTVASKFYDDDLRNVGVAYLNVF